MRIKQSFTAADLALVAAKDTEVHAVQSITRFLHRLAASGYLYTYKRRRAGYKQYRLIRNTGEFSPAFRRAGGVYDRNLKELQK